MKKTADFETKLCKPSIYLPRGRCYQFHKTSGSGFVDDSKPFRISERQECGNDCHHVIENQPTATQGIKVL